MYICKRLILKKYAATHSIAYITIYNKHKHNHHYFHPVLSPHSQSMIDQDRYIPCYVKGKKFDPKASADPGSKTGFKEVRTRSGQVFIWIQFTTGCWTQSARLSRRLSQRLFYRLSYRLFYRLFQWRYTNR